VYGQTVYVADGAVIWLGNGARCLPATGNIAVPMWVRSIVGATHVLWNNMLIRLPSEPEWREGRVESWRMVVGSFSGPFETVHAEGRVASLHGLLLEVETEVTL
jgi:hypothetical protein